MKSDDLTIVRTESNVVKMTFRANGNVTVKIPTTIGLSDETVKYWANMAFVINSKLQPVKQTLRTKLDPNSERRQLYLLKDNKAMAAIVNIENVDDILVFWLPQTS